MGSVIRTLIGLCILACLGYIVAKQSEPDHKCNVLASGMLTIDGKDNREGATVSYKDIYYGLLICSNLSKNHKPVRLKNIYAFKGFGNFVVCSNFRIEEIKKPPPPGPNF